MLQLLELPRPGRLHHEPGDAERLEQVVGRVRVEIGRFERVPEARQHSIQNDRTIASRWPRPEITAQNPVVHVGTPWQPRVHHLSRDKRPGGLGGEQKPETSRVIGTRDRRALKGEFGERVLVGETGLRLIEVEERIVLGAFGGLRRGAVPRVRRCGRESRRRRERGVAQDGVREPQVDAALDPHATGKQDRVPVAGVVPHPARMLRLDFRHSLRQATAVDRALLAHAFSVRAQWLQHRPLGTGEEGNVHRTSLPAARDIRSSTHRGRPDYPSLSEIQDFGTKTARETPLRP